MRFANRDLFVYRVYINYAAEGLTATVMVTLLAIGVVTLRTIIVATLLPVVTELVISELRLGVR